MPPPSFFTRARRIFQNASPPQQSDHPHLAPADSDPQLHYETDGSSYEMLVIDSPSKALQVSQQHPGLNHNHNHLRQNKSKKQRTKQVSNNQTTEQHQQHLEKHPEKHPDQKPGKAPDADSDKEPNKQSAQHTPPPHPPSEPQTPSQKLPVALRRIDATPIKLDDTPGYNLRPRTRSRSHAPPTPQRRTPARSRRRELRQAPSARTTSGIAARPSIISRRQIDESSYVTLRAMCRSFGLPASGTKAELRARAIEKFENHRVLDEQTQLLDNQHKFQEAAPNAVDMRLQPCGKNVTPEDENEENSAHVQRDVQRQATDEGGVGDGRQKSGKQITTSTVKPAGRVKQLPVEATKPARSDEPSVHAKSDAPEKDPCRQAVTPAECSTANSPSHAAAQEAQKTAQPTVSSTGAEVNSPGSPRLPPPHPTPRLPDIPFPFQTRDRPSGPTESVDARGGDVDVAGIFQDLASGRRKLSAVEYEAVLRTLKDSAPDRLQPMQIPINAARVSLSTLPTTPNFKPPLARPSVAVSGVMPSQRKSPLLAKTLCNSSPRAMLGSSELEKARTGNREAAGKLDSNKTTVFEEANVVSATKDPELMEKPKGEGARQEKGASLGKGPAAGEEEDVVNSNRSKEGKTIQQKPAVHSERENESKMETKRKGLPKELESGGDTKLEVVEVNQNPLPSIFEGARGGPHEGNIIDRSGVHNLVRNVKGVPATPGEGRRILDSEQDGSCKDKQDDREVVRGGLATPREMVRRFNRFRNADTNDDEEFPLKPYPDGDPATSLLRRNARRSSSGVPLFYSARGPSTAGRSISKARTASKAREAQDHLRQMDRLHNLSGRASFRVKRPLSASAGALLVDLRRTSVSGGSGVERMDQRGSFQAELARRPPPMAASALKILNDLQQIQQESRAQANRKRAVPPPPLPPSVVKRARRDGRFASSELRNGQRFGAMSQTETEMERKGSGTSIFTLDGTSHPGKPGSSLPIGRQTPRIPPVAYGAGKRKSKRSRTSRLTSIVLSDTEDHADKCSERIDTRENREGTYGDTDVSRMKRRRQQETAREVEKDNHFTASQDKSKKMSLMGTRPVVPSACDEADADSKVELPKTSAVPFGIAKPASGTQSEALQLHESNQYKVPKKPGDTPLKTFTEPSSRMEPGKSERAGADLQASDRKKFQTPPRTVMNFPAMKKPTTTGQGKELETPARAGGDNKFSTGVELRTTSALKEQNRKEQSLREKCNRVPGDGFVSADMKAHKTGSIDRDDKTEASPPVLQPPDSPFNFRTTQSQYAKDSGTHLISGAPVRSLSNVKTSGESSLGLPASPFGPAMTPFSAQGKLRTSEEDEKPETNLDGEISIPSKTFPRFQSFEGKENPTGLVSAPSIRRNEGDETIIMYGVPSSQKSIQLAATSELRRSSLPEGASTMVKQATPLTSEQAPTIAVAPMNSKESNALSTLSPSNKMEPDKPAEGSSNLFTAPVKAGVGVLPDGKSEGLRSSKVSAFATENDEQSIDEKAQPPAKGTGAMATSTTPTSTPALNLGDNSTVSNPLVGGSVLTTSNKQASPFTGGPFSRPGGESDSKPEFSFTTTPKAPGRTTDGPFAEREFKSPFSSSASGTMFVFGSSTGSAAAVKPAPSIGVLGDSATPDEAKNIPFALPTSTTPFGQQPVAKTDGVAQTSGPTFGMPSSAGVATGFDAPTTGTAPGFESSFGSSPALFTATVNTSFAAAPTLKPFGGSTDSKTPVFGSMKAPTIPFGSSSGPVPAPTFGASSSGPAAAPTFGASGSGPAATPSFGTPSSGPAASPTFGGSSSGPAAADMFAAPSGGTSTPGFGSTAPQTFSFGNANVNTFGSSSTQPNPFNQNANLGSMSSATMFGTRGGDFNMGSATRAPPTQRRRLRGRRTLR